MANYWWDYNSIVWGGWSMNNLTNTNGRLSNACTGPNAGNCTNGSSGVGCSYGKKAKKEERRERRKVRRKWEKGRKVSGTCEKMCFEERGVGTMVGEWVTFVGW